MEPVSGIADGSKKQNYRLNGMVFVISTASYRMAGPATHGRMIPIYDAVQFYPKKVKLIVTKDGRLEEIHFDCDGINSVLE